MDKITSYNIQTNLNPRSLNSRISDIGAFDSMVSRVSDTWVSEASDSKVSEVSSRGLGLGSFLLESEKWSLRPGPKTFTSFDFPRLWLGPVGLWVWWRLIHDPTVTPKFPCLEDYGNSYASEDGSNFRGLLQFRNVYGFRIMLESEA